MAAGPFGYHFSEQLYMPTIRDAGLRSSSEPPYRLFFGMDPRELGYMDIDSYGFDRHGILLRFPLAAIPAPYAPDPRWRGDWIAEGPGPFVMPAGAVEYRDPQTHRWRPLRTWTPARRGQWRTADRGARRRGVR